MDLFRIMYYVYYSDVEPGDDLITHTLLGTFIIIMQ